jgi:hypothetical protein
VVSIIGRINRSVLRDNEVHAIGLLRVGILTAEEEATLIGGGRVDLLASKKCTIASSHKPLILGNVYCGSIIAIGSKNPVVIGYLRASKVYARKTFIGKLHTSEAVLSELCIVDELEYAEKLLFVDPHMYIRKIGEAKNIDYAYNPYP